MVIAGGGLAAQRCAETLRRVGYEGRIRIVCAEPHRALRPPAALEGGARRTRAPRTTVGFRAGGLVRASKQVELLLGARATGLDPPARRLELDDGSSLAYEHLVIATGSAPRTLPAFDGYENVSTLRTLEDSRRAARAARRHARGC